MFGRLKDWAARRVIERAIAERQRRGLKRGWWDGVAGGSSAAFSGGGLGRLTASLATWSASVNSDLDATLVVMRARARGLAANNEHGRRFLNLVAGNVVGAAGPTLQVRAKVASGRLDKAANDAVETAWAEWTERADLTGRMDLAQLLRVALKAVARDGEALVRFVRNRSLPHGIQLQILEADRLDESVNTKLASGNVVRQGVELDSAGRAVAYWLKASHPGENQQAVAPQLERVPADQVLHLFLPERAEQVRGYTWFHAVLVRMNMLHAYEEAAVVAARVGAAKMGVFQRKDEGTPSTLGSMADSTDSTGRLQMSAEAGEFMELPPGYELANWDPEYPHANFEAFLKACLRGVAAGLDTAAHNLTGDMTDVNYSSARIAELAERDHWMVLQRWFVFAAMRPIYERWLESALILNVVTLGESGKALPADRYEKFRAASRFQPRRWSWVDPAKEIEAAEREIAAGLNSRTAIAASQGREVEDIFDELAQEKALLVEAGLPWQVGKAAAAPEPAHADVPPPAAKAEPAFVVNVAPAAVNVDARSTVNVPERAVEVKGGDVNVTVPEREVHLEAQIDATTRVEAGAVNVNAYPERVEETIERDEAKEITRITRTAMH